MGLKTKTPAGCRRYKTKTPRWWRGAALNEKIISQQAAEQIKKIGKVKEGREFYTEVTESTEDTEKRDKGRI